MSNVTGCGRRLGEHRRRDGELVVVVGAVAGAVDGDVRDGRRVRRCPGWRSCPSLPRSRSCAVGDRAVERRLVDLRRAERAVEAGDARAGVPQVVRSAVTKPSPRTTNGLGSMTFVEPFDWSTSTPGASSSAIFTSNGASSVVSPCCAGGVGVGDRARRRRCRRSAETAHEAVAETGVVDVDLEDELRPGRQRGGRAARPGAGATPSSVENDAVYGSRRRRRDRQGASPEAVAVKRPPCVMTLGELRRDVRERVALLRRRSRRTSR